MMKLKAIKNIDGVVKAFAGQEFEVTNLQQAKDLIQQGVAYSTDTQGQEVQNLMNQSEEEMFWQAEVEAVRLSERQKAESEFIQKDVNTLEDQKQEKLQQIKEEAKMEGEQLATQKLQQAEEKKIQRAEEQIKQAEETMNQAQKKTQQAKPSGGQKPSQQEQAQAQKNIPKAHLNDQTF
jgi:hypothetical protein